MGPKIQAIINFLEGGGEEAIITNSENIERALLGETGTRILPQVRAQLLLTPINGNLNTTGSTSFIRLSGEML